MKKFICTLILIVSLASWCMPQDVVYATAFSGISGKIKSITANANTGATSGGFTDVENIPASAALGADQNGWLYFLKYGSSGTGDGDGKVSVYATRADGVGSETKVAEADLNGNSGKELTFVRLGVDANNTAWILSAETGVNPKLYLGKFPCNGSAPTTVTVVTSNLNVSDGSNSIFQNGDICFDGSGTMYALANDGNGNTKIYTVIPSSIAVNGNAVMNYKWSLKEKVGNSMQNFSGQVGGCAFSSTGSMYICTTLGLYFIDQNTVNFAGTGTVVCKLIEATTGLTDVATVYVPAQTKLPIHFKAIRTKALGHGLIQVEFDVEEASGTNYYNIQLSKDGVNFKTVMIQFPEGTKPDQTYIVKIQL